MILLESEIKKQIDKGNIKISPFNKKQLNPNSYNVKLDNELFIYTDDVLNISKANNVRRILIPEDGLILQPNQLYLAKTVEYTETKKFVPMIEGRSSLARLGINIHITAGFGDVGFKGFWTLEISCIKPIIILPYIEIAQIYFLKGKGKTKGYNGKYQNNSGIQKSLIYKEIING